MRKRHAREEDKLQKNCKHKKWNAPRTYINFSDEVKYSRECSLCEFTDYKVDK